jgi:serine protease Do
MNGSFSRPSFKTVAGLARVRDRRHFQSARSLVTSATALLLLVGFGVTPACPAASSFVSTIHRVLPKVVKIYGAGGLRGLEAYQTGILISPEGHVLTAWSTVLDTDNPVVILDDGRRFESELLGANPQLEIAVLKLSASDLPYFNLSNAASAQVGQRVLAFSNLFKVATGDEPVSVQRGVIAAITQLSARRGVFQTPYSGPVYVTDALTNNPGAAGGALTNLRGELLGMLGKELRNAQDNTWLNYSLPIDQLRSAIDDIKAGKTRPRRDPDELLPRTPVDLARLGILLVPEVVDNTPPFIDAVRSGSPAAAAGLHSDDLILFVNNVLVQSLDDLQEECRRIARDEQLQLTIRRGDQLKVILLDDSATSEKPQ